MPFCPRCGESTRTRWTRLGPLLLCVGLWAIPLGFLFQRMYPFGVLVMIVATGWAARRVRRVCARCGAERAVAGGGSQPRS